MATALDESVPVPSAVVPSIKVTVPVGVPEPEEGATVAVKVTLWPTIAGLGEAVSAVVVVAGAVTTGTELLISNTFPARISGLPSLLRSTAMAGEPVARLMRSLGTM